MSFPAPVLPIVGPLLAAVVVFVLGRWRRVQIATGVGAAFILAITIATLPVNGDSPTVVRGLFNGQTWSIALRRLVINEGLQDLFVFFFVALGLLFLVSYLFWQGSTFLPGSLISMSLLCAALMAQVFSIAAIILVLGAAVLVMSYTPVKYKKTHGALRYLLLFVLALAPLLLAAWLIESGQAPLNASLIVLMLAVAFAVFLAGFPFYIWVYPLIAEVPYLVPGLLFGLGQTAVIILILSLMEANAWLPANTQFQNWLAWSGTGTVLVAALLTLTAGRWRFLWGHLLLLNMGMSVLTLTLPIQAAVDAAIFFHLTRFISLLLAGTAFSFLGRQGWQETIASSKGFSRRAPLTIALLGYSFFSLLGTPLTLGFPAQWSVITAFGQEASVWLSTLLVLAMAIAAFRVLRILANTIQGHTGQRVHLETGWQRAVTLIMLLAALLLAFFPQPLLNYAKGISAAIFG